jgi:hypothetical protein
MVEPFYVITGNDTTLLALNFSASAGEEFPVSAPTFADILLNPIHVRQASQMKFPVKVVSHDQPPETPRLTRAAALSSFNHIRSFALFPCSWCMRQYYNGKMGPKEANKPVDPVGGLPLRPDCCKAGMMLSSSVRSISKVSVLQRKPVSRDLGIHISATPSLNLSFTGCVFVNS